MRDAGHTTNSVLKAFIAIAIILALIVGQAYLVATLWNYVLKPEEIHQLGVGQGLGLLFLSKLLIPTAAHQKTNALSTKEVTSLSSNESLKDAFLKVNEITSRKGIKQ